MRAQGAVCVVPQHRFYDSDAAACTKADSPQAAHAKLEAFTFQDGGKYVLQYAHISLAEQVSQAEPWPLEWIQTWI